MKIKHRVEIPLVVPVSPEGGKGLRSITRAELLDQLTHLGDIAMEDAWFDIGEDTRGKPTLSLIWDT